MIGKIILTFFYFVTGFFIVWLTTKSKSADKLSAVLIAYAVGLVIGNIGIIPESLNSFQDLLSNISLGVALPMILFSMNFKHRSKFLGKTLLSTILGILALIIVLFAAYFIFKDNTPHINKILGLMSGLYTGGMPNLASLKVALNVDQTEYVLVSTADMTVNAIILLLVISVGQRFFNLFLPKFDFEAAKKEETESDRDISEFNDYKDIFKKKIFRDLIIAFLLAVIILVVSFIIGKVSVKFGSVISILCLTSFGIITSFIKPVRSLKKTFPTGMYFVYVFSLIIASMADFKTIFTLHSLNFLLLVLFVVVMSFMVHALLSKIFKVDTDTFLVSTVALVYSTPFVPVVADALKNKYIIVSGIFVSLVGYSVGNYLGVLISYILK